MSTERESKGLRGSDDRATTLTFDGRYHCAICGTCHEKLCFHWQRLLNMAVKAAELAASDSPAAPVALIGIKAEYDAVDEELDKRGFPRKAGEYELPLWGRVAAALRSAATPAGPVTDAREDGTALPSDPHVQIGGRPSIPESATPSGAGVSGLYPAQIALEHDRTKVAECITAAKKALHNYSWLIESRGSYEWDDDRWHGEFREACDLIAEAIGPMIRIAADWSNCPQKWEDIQMARAGVSGQLLTERGVMTLINRELQQAEDERPAGLKATYDWERLAKSVVSAQFGQTIAEARSIDSVTKDVQK